MLMEYVQAERVSGNSSYSAFDYCKETIISAISGDAAASRLAIALGSSGILLAIILGVMITINFMSTKSGYVGGATTIMILVLVSFGLQMLLFGVLSRQIEGIRTGGLRRSVIFHRMGK